MIFFVRIHCQGGKNMLKRYFPAVMIFVLFVLFLSCAGPSMVSVKVHKPAAIHLADVKKIAVVDFIGEERSGSQIATLTQSILMGTQYYEILERDKLQRVLEEQNLALAGVVDDATAAEVGKLLGVDAMIFGEVTMYDVEDFEEEKMVKERVGTGRYQTVEKKDKKTGKIKKEREEIYQEVMVPKKYWVRKGDVAINFRVVDVETGKLLAAQSDSKSYDSEKGKSFFQAITDARQLKPKGEILSELSEGICKNFVRMIAPYFITEKRIIESGPGEIGIGAKYAESGLWPEAMDSWKRAMVEAPQEPAVYYDLGLAHEVSGDLDKAEEMYSQAVKMKQKKLYMEAITRIRNAKKEHEKLMKQMMGREE
jgi:curli biogenesis system outer membrane secretion channel CsgG